MVEGVQPEERLRFSLAGSGYEGRQLWLGHCVSMYRAGEVEAGPGALLRLPALATHAGGIGVYGLRSNCLEATAYQEMIKQLPGLRVKQP